MGPKRTRQPEPYLTSARICVRYLDDYWCVKAVGTGFQSVYSGFDHFAIISEMPKWPIILLFLVFIGYTIWQVFA